ncbi:hypothetical protein [Pedobacter sandarakinus]|uniref:hypothetical protein n=1 Tax=Pedobacter sandarakinus TaxID=353156 RepID=UPI0022450A49|nr:hypothetical protein [Pedobacter sandarakinus]MCX2575981.1 hypothetical protein [Pedobacter sandarakinus]
MVKFKIFLALFFLGITFAHAQLSNKEIAILKVDLVRAVEDSKLTDSMYENLLKLNNKTALVMGYMGTLEALKAKHAWNPYNKIKYVKLALKTMQKAIDMDRENLEIRFMRFSIEHFTPGFLGFSKDLTVDRKEIIKHYRNENFGVADTELIKNVAKFMIESKRCTPDEVKILKRYI